MALSVFRIILKKITKIRLGLGIKRRLSVFSNPFYSQFGPRIVSLDPTLIRCNHKCVMCWQRTLTDKEKLVLWQMDKKKSLGFREYKKMLENLPFTVSDIHLAGGGEPLLHPEIWEIMELIKRCHFYGTLITNGSLLNKDNIENLFRMKWDFIRISFHAAERKTYAKIHGKDDFQKVMQAVKTIKKIKNKKPVNFMKLSLHYVIQRLNYNQILKFAKLAEELGAEAIEFDNLNPFVKDTLLDKKQLITAIKMLKSVSRDCQLPNNANILVERYENFYRKSGAKEKLVLDKNRFLKKKCNLISDRVILDALGNVYPCCFFINPQKKMGNIKKELINEIWNKPKYRKIRHKLLKGKFEPECFKLCSFIS